MAFHAARVAASLARMLRLRAACSAPRAMERQLHRRRPCGSVEAVVLAVCLVMTVSQAVAQPDYAAMTLVWSTPATAPGEPAPCARMLLLNLPRDWQVGDAAAVVAGPSDAGFAVAQPVIAALIAQQAAVLELPAGSGGGVGACAAVPILAGAQLLGALGALRLEVGAGIVVAISVDADGSSVFDALEEARAVRLLGPRGPRFSAAAALRTSDRAAFRAGTPPPPEERWPDRAAHLCAALAAFIGPEGPGECLAAFRGEAPSPPSARLP